jgi:hypothetical protein
MRNPYRLELEVNEIFKRIEPVWNSETTLSATPRP